MRRLLAGIAAAILSLAGSLATPWSSAAVAARPKLPRDFVTLEGRMARLHVNTERGTAVVSLSGVRLGGRHGLFEVPEGKRARRTGKEKAARAAVSQLPFTPLLKIPLLTADFETSVSPRLAVVRAEVLGGLSFQLRLIGEQAYTRSPFSGLIDEHKPWVSTTPAERAKERAGNKAEEALPLPEIGEPKAGFNKQVGWLAKARSVVEVGPAAVDGQPTTEFRATFDLKQTLAALIAGSAKGPQKGSVHAHETLYLFLASDGLPVRTHALVQQGKARLDAAIDILETEVPVSVTPPPAGETISEAELKQREGSGSGPVLEAESRPLTKREKAEARRFEACMNRRLHSLPKHRKRVSHRGFAKLLRECERRAKLRPSVKRDSK